MFASLLDHAVVDELRHEVGSGLSALQFCLHLLHLLLHVLELGQLHLILSFPLFCRLLLRLNLLEGAAPLAADLQHVGGHALRY